MQHIKFPKIFRALTAMVLALLLLLGTMTTGLAAVADELAKVGSVDTSKSYYIVGSGGGISGSWNTWKQLTKHPSGYYSYYQLTGPADFQITDGNGSWTKYDQISQDGFWGAGGWTSGGFYWSGSNLHVTGAGYVVVWYPNSELRTDSTPCITYFSSLPTPPSYKLYGGETDGSDWTKLADFTTTDNPASESSTFTATTAALDANTKYYYKIVKDYSSFPNFTSSSNYDTTNDTMYLGCNSNITGSATGLSFSNSTNDTATFTTTVSAPYSVSITASDWKNKTATVSVTYPTTYTVTFNSNGGSEVTAQTVIAGGTATKPNDPTKTGYSFGEWQLNDSTYNFSTAVNSNITLTATWTETPRSATVEAATHGKTSLTGSGYTAASKTVSNIGIATKGDVYAQADSGYFFTGWTGTSSVNFDSNASYNAKSLHAKFNVRADSQTVTANFAKEVAMEGMTIYLKASNGLDPAVYYATDVSGANSIAGTHAQQYSTSGIYHTEIPAVPENAAYNYNCVRFVIGSKDSGYIPITDVLNNSITYNDSTYSAPARSTTQYSGYGKIYFDNTSTNWNISGSNKLYFVIGNSSSTSLLQMSKVSNTSQLYYLANGNWDNYTFFGFALATSASTANIVEKTTYISYYNLANSNGSDKSFIGFGLGENSDNVSALDFLWIKDTAIDGTGVYVADRSTNEGNYLNRGQKVTAGANGTVSVNYYKATSAGTSGVTAQTGSVSAGSNSTFYASRSTVFKFRPVPNEGYDVGTVTYDGVGLSGPDGNGDYTFTVVGGDDTAYAIQNINVTFSQNSNPVVNSLTTSPATAGTAGVNLGDDVTLTAANTNPAGNIVYTVTKNGSAVTATDYLKIGGVAADRQAAAASNTAVFSSLEPGTYIVTATMGSSSKNATIVVNEPPAKMLLGLWVGSDGNAWTPSTTNNPDRVMTYMTSGPYSGKYYLELSLPDNANFYRTENGFKVYSVDDNSWHGNSGKMTGTSDWTMDNANSNCELEAIRITGSTESHIYKFVYDATTNKMQVLFPQVITYDMNYAGDTDTQLAVTYGGKAKNITPTRAGYSFDGWYTTATTANQNASTAVDFNAAITTAKTYYAKWSVNNANIKIVKTENGTETVIAAQSSTFSGIDALTVAKPAASAGLSYVFRGWILSGNNASHVRLYTDAACTTAYVAGSDAATIYVKTDGTAGISEANCTLTARYDTRNVVGVTGEDACEYFTAISGSSTNPQDIYYGTNVNVIFNNMSGGFGIKSVTFAAGEEVAYTNHGHYITFDMPAHDVHITDVEVQPLDTRITVKDADKVDVDGVSASGYYAKGADVNEIIIEGSDDYHGTSVLTALNVKYVGGDNVTVNSSNGEADLTFNGYTLHIEFDDGVATITGNIGGNVILTPTCSTLYNINITSKVMSDVGAKYVSYNKKETTPLGETESVTIADLKVYLELDDEPDEDEAEELGLAWPLDYRDHDGDTFYLIEVDEDGDYIGKFEENSHILLVTENLNNKYSFIGWFPGSSTGPTLAEAESTTLIYDYVLTESTFQYGVATRDIYLGGDGASSNKGLGATISWSSAAQMTYDAENMVYYHETASLTVDTHYYFKIFDLAATGNNNSSGTTNQAVWYNAAKSVNYNSDYGNVTIDTHHSINSNGQCEFHLTSGTNTVSNKVRIYYKPSTQEVYIIPVFDESYHEIYLSNGRIDGLASKLGLTLTKPTQQITTPAQDGTGYSITTDTSKWEDQYSYKKFTGTLETVSFQVTINGSSAGDALVSGFVVYNMDTGDATTAEATKSGNVYTGTISNVSANTFICPVYELTDSYATAQGYSKHEVFVNAADIDTNVWGDLVAMYLFGGDGTARDNNGGWPGQLMLPSGKTFTGVIYQKDSAKLSGVLFNNYNVYDSSGNPSSFLGKFGKRFNYPDWAQTYDYAEPITLMSRSSTLLTFSLKQNNDGYRGLYYNTSTGDKRKGPYQLDLYNTNNNECVPGKAYDYYDEELEEHQTIFDTYTFEYLTDKDGKDRLNMYGEPVGSAPAGYYVICVGDIDYKNHNASSYTPYDATYLSSVNTAYDGEYSVEWYIYDADGIFLGHTLSDSLYSHKGASDKPYVVDMLMESGYITDISTLSEKSIKISYEAPNRRKEATRFSGQWYANSTNEKVTVYAGVGMMATIDGKEVAIVPENPQSNTSYGTSVISYGAITGAMKGTINGLNWASLKLSDATNGAITLTAGTVGDSTFMGWYSYNEAKDEYTKVGDSLVFNPKFGADSRYFAMFTAQATYYFNYTGRNGLVSYSVKASVDALPAEMLNGGHLDPTDEDRLDDLESAAAILSNVLVFNHTVSFSLTDLSKIDASNPYELTIEGTTTETSYNLTVYAYNDSGNLVPKQIIPGTWSTWINLDASYSSVRPNASDVFYGWKEYNPSSGFVGDFLSTQGNYGYSITQNMTIAPVFGPASGKAAALGTGWQAGIDRNVISQEFSDDGSIIYNDALVNFRNKADSGEQFDLDANECGIVILFQTHDATASYGSNFTSISDDRVKSLVGTMCTGNMTRARLSTANYNSGEAYAYRIKAEELSRLNRTQLWMSVDHAKFTGGNYKIVAYTKVGGDYSYSTIQTGTFTKGQKFPAV